MPQKPTVVGRRNAENDKNSLSSADETQNHPIFTHRRPTKRKKTAKTALRRATKCKIARFLLFARKRNTKSPVFYSSLASETQNHSFFTLRS